MRNVTTPRDQSHQKTTRQCKQKQCRAITWYAAPLRVVEVRVIVVDRGWTTANAMCPPAGYRITYFGDPPLGLPSRTTQQWCDFSSRFSLSLWLNFLEQSLKVLPPPPWGVIVRTRAATISSWKPRPPPAGARYATDLLRKCGNSLSFGTDRTEKVRTQVIVQRNLKRDSRGGTPTQRKPQFLWPVGAEVGQQLWTVIRRPDIRPCGGE